MGPKKKTNKASGEAEPEQIKEESKPKVQPKVVDVPEKSEKKVIVSEAKEVTKPPVVNAPIEQKRIQQKPVSQTKINLDEGANLSEAELLKRRQLRFNVVGTEITSLEADKIKEERLSKFGGQMNETADDVEKRRLKFGLANGAVEDNALKSRLQKFGGNVSNIEDKGAIDERRKKFGVSTNLDDEINKSKKNYHDNKRDHSFNRGKFGQSFKRFKR